MSEGESSPLSLCLVLFRSISSALSSSLSIIFFFFGRVHSGLSSSLSTSSSSFTSPFHSFGSSARARARSLLVVLFGRAKECAALGLIIPSASIRGAPLTQLSVAGFLGFLPARETHRDLPPVLSLSLCLSLSIAPELLTFQTAESR